MNEYERWFQSRPEYWAQLTDTLTATVIASNGRSNCAVSGEIDIRRYGKITVVFIDTYCAPNAPF